MKHIQTSRGSLFSMCGKQVEFCETATNFDSDCPECQIQYKRRNIFKFSDYMAEVMPHMDFETIKIVLKECRKFESNIHGRYCSICMIKLTEEERELISPIDFLTCCTEHKEYAQYFQVEKIREKLGLKVEDLPFYE